jgi:hypothetical protein
MFYMFETKCWVFPLGVIVPYSLPFSCPPFLEHLWNLTLNPKLHTNGTTQNNKDDITKRNDTMGQSCVYSPICQEWWVCSKKIVNKLLQLNHNPQRWYVGSLQDRVVHFFMTFYFLHIVLYWNIINIWWNHQVTKTFTNWNC